MPPKKKTAPKKAPKRTTKQAPKKTQNVIVNVNSNNKRGNTTTNKKNESKLPTIAPVVFPQIQAPQPLAFGPNIQPPPPPQPDMTFHNEILRELGKTNEAINTFKEASRQRVPEAPPVRNQPPVGYLQRPQLPEARIIPQPQMPPPPTRPLDSGVSVPRLPPKTPKYEPVKATPQAPLGFQDEVLLSGADVTRTPTKRAKDDTYKPRSTNAIIKMDSSTQANIPKPLPRDLPLDAYVQARSNFASVNWESSKLEPSARMPIKDMATRLGIPTDERMKYKTIDDEIQRKLLKRSE